MKNSVLLPTLSFALLLTGCSTRQVVQNTVENNAVSSIEQSSVSSEDAENLVWKNEKLGYQFSYPSSAKVTYNERTADGACTYVHIMGTDVSLSVSFIDSKALQANPEYGSFFCNRTDAPLGMRGNEQVQMQALKKKNTLDCSTDYYHGGEYSETPSDAVIQKDCYYRLVEEHDADDNVHTVYGSYVVSTDYGKTIPVAEVEKMSTIARSIIASFSTTK